MLRAFSCGLGWRAFKDRFVGAAPAPTEGRVAVSCRQTCLRPHGNRRVWIR